MPSAPPEPRNRCESWATAPSLQGSTRRCAASSRLIGQRWLPTTPSTHEWGGSAPDEVLRQFERDFPCEFRVRQKLRLGNHREQHCGFLDALPESYSAWQTFHDLDTDVRVHHVPHHLGSSRSDSVRRASRSSRATWGRSWSSPTILASAPAGLRPGRGTCVASSSALSGICHPPPGRW